MSPVDNLTTQPDELNATVDDSADIGPIGPMQERLNATVVGADYGN